MKKVLILGNGFIASHLPYEISKYRTSTDEDDIRDLFSYYKPDVIINTIGYCGIKNVDDCESNKSKTNMANIVIPTLLAKICNELNIHFIHIGSGCIFFGPSQNLKTKNENLQALGPNGWRLDSNSNNIYEGGWKEEDIANPLSHYSKTKYACDLAIGSLNTTTILRIRMPISPLNHPRNLLNKLIKYPKVLEEQNSMTFTDDLVRAADFVIENNKTGIYHIANPQPLTHSVLLDEYKKYVPKHIYETITKEELQNLVIAPRSNCILDCSKIEQEGFKFTDINESIQSTVERFVKNLGK